MPKWSLIYEDHFADASIGGEWQQGPGAGSLAETTALTLALTTGQAGDWWSSAYNGVGIWHPGIGYDKGFYYVEARLTNYTRGPNNYTTAGILVLGSAGTGGDKSRMYYGGYYPGNGYAYVQYVNGGSAGDIWNKGSNIGDPNTTPHRYRIYWNSTPRVKYIDQDGRALGPGQMAYYYSADDGTTWNFGVIWTPFFTDFGGFGLCMRNWNTQLCSTTWDYFRFYADQEEEALIDGSPSSGPNKGSFEDRAGLVNLGGELDPNFGMLSGPGIDLRKEPGGSLEDGSYRYLVQDDAGAEDTRARDKYGSLEDASRLLEAGGAVLDKLRLTTVPHLSAGLLLQPKGSLEDSAEALLPFDTTFWYQRSDSDGRVYLGDTDVLSLLYVDSTLEPWNTPATPGFYGIGRDGRIYYDGQLAQPGTFGTVADGLNKRSWCIGGQEPLGISRGALTSAPTIVSDDHIRLTSQGNQVEAGSRMRWALTGDFDIQVSWENFAYTGGSDGGIYFLIQGPDGYYQTYVRRNVNGRIDSDLYRNGWLNYGWVSAGGATSGRFRFTRTGSTVRRYYWTGSSWAQLGSDQSFTTEPLMVTCSNSPVGSTMCTGDFFSFTINSGTYTNYCGWARESAGATRGSKVDFPLHALVVATRSSIDIIDADTNLVWMKFSRGTNNVLHAYSGTPSAPYMVMKDGVLFVAYRSRPQEGDEGGAIWIDFNIDWIRTHRMAASTVTGGIVRTVNSRGEWPRDTTHGAMRVRNAGVSLFNDYDKYQIQTYRTNAVEVYHASPWQYRFVATNDGISGFRWKRWYFEGDTDSHIDNPSRGISTETGSFYWVAVDPVTQDLLYTNLSTLYVAHETTWKAGITYPGGSWTSDHQWALPGASIGPDYNRGGVINGGYLYLNRNEGLYRVEIATGTSVHLYGTAESSATHKILPSDLKSVTALYRTLDGATPVWLLAVEREMGTQIYMIDVGTNVVLARSTFLRQRTIRAVAA